MNGLVLIDKPPGPTSNQISMWVKDILKTKTAHVGTLDPSVSGVLPILFGKGIKLLEYLQKHDKEYICLMELELAVPKKKIEVLFSEFTGKIYQRPPEISAVSKKMRIRQIYKLNLIEIKGNHVLFDVHCQHGTYVRKLVEDFGHVLGLKTKMLELRRTRAGRFTEDECHILTQLKDAAELYKDGKNRHLEKMVLPLEHAVRDFPKAYVKNSAVENLKQGADLFAPGLIKTTGHIVKSTPVAMIDEDDKLIGIGLALFEKSELEKKKKGPIIKTKKIII